MGTTSATTLDPFGRSCYWTSCSFVDKTALRELMLRVCSCGRSVHVACLADMLQTFQAPRGFDMAVCSKNCYDAIWGQAHGRGEAAVATPVKESRPTTSLRWHNDGPTPDVCSLSVLLDWLTTGNNYRRFSSSATQVEKSIVAQEVVSAMAARELKTKRTHADVIVAIHLFEKAYKAAQDWIKATQREEMDGGVRRTGILKRCVHFDRLHPVMGEKYQVASPPHAVHRVSVDAAESNGAKDQDERNAEPIQQERPPKKQRTATAAAATKPAPKPSVVEPPQICSRSKTPLAVREAEARIQEALAHASKLRQEENFMGLQAAVMLLRERVKLRQEGVPQDDIDLFLPLYAHTPN